jgi:DNA polymerase-3 subunit epsilon
MKKAMSVDVQTIFHKKEKRTLEAAYKFYCDQNLDDAHSAAADTNATFEVLKAQLDKYDDLENDINFLASFSAHREFADFAGYIGFNKKGQEVFSFGKHKGTLVEDVLENEPGYFGWLLNADFPLYTKKVLTGIKLRKLNNKLT